MTTKERLRFLLDLVPEERAPDVEALLLRVLNESGQDVSPAVAALRAAPPDDESISGAEERAVAAGRRDAKAGRIRGLDEVERELFG